MNVNVPGYISTVGRKGIAFRGKLAMILMIIVAVSLPALLKGFWLHILTEILIMGLFASSFNLLFGYMGLMSFGQAAYFGVGAYATTLLWLKGGLPFPVCILAAPIAAGAVALLFGPICVRLGGIYFAILTMSFGQVVYYIVFNWYGFTGGDNGIQGVRPPEFLMDIRNYYYYCLGVVISALLLLRALVESPFGYTLKAIRDNGMRVQFLGINVFKFRLINFIISGMFAGLAGSLFAFLNRSVNPSLLNWDHSGIPVFMAVIGGPLNFWGPFLGAIIYIGFAAFVTGVTEYWPLVIGIIITIIILYMPGGIVPLFIARMTNSRIFTRMLKLEGTNDPPKVC